MNRIIYFLVIAASLVGCAAEVSSASKDQVDVDLEDATIASAEGSSDSAARPTLQGELQSGDTDSASFSRSAKYLAWDFQANEGDLIHLTAQGDGASDVDTVLVLYNATAAGRPTGRSIALNDDAAEGVTFSEIEVTAPATRNYVAIVRRYDRGASGTVQISLGLDDGEPAPHLCPATGVTCSLDCSNGRLPGGRPCHYGRFNGETCACEAP